MKKELLLLSTVLVLMMCTFGVSSHAEIAYCDFSVPKGGDIDGLDLSQFIAYYAAADSPADVNRDGIVDSNDVAHFASFFGSTYRLPNILLIIADDVGIDVATNLYPGLIDDLAGMYGNAVRGRPASLPVLTDRLAQQGMVFLNTWAQPYCSPSRATMITGLFEDKTQVKKPDDPLSSHHTTFVQRLKSEANYSTAAFGKWHLAGPSPNWSGVRPRQAGFDFFRGNFDSYIPDYWSYVVHVQDNNTTGTNYSTESAPTKFLPGIASTKYAPVVKAADTIDWINARTTENPDKPWFVWLAFNLSHVTFEYLGAQGKMVVPNADTLDDPSWQEMHDCGGTFGSNIVGSCTGRQLMRAMTNSMDTVIGKVLDVIDSLDSDTYVIFIGDNGTPMYGYPIGNQIDNMYITINGRGKGTPYESGCRVPLVIRGPGITAGTQSAGFVHEADLFATCLQLAGLEVAPENLDYLNSAGNSVQLDAVSLTPILFGPATTLSRDPKEGYLLTEVGVYYGSPNKVGARNATYKVLCTTNTSNCTFYNLVDDPLEEDPITDSRRPNSCTDYNNTWAPPEPQWNYCRLIEVVNQYSIFP
jgi:arylsulfatase A-like enzyme